MKSLLRLSVLLALLCALVYANSLFNGFVYDDWDLVVHNQWVKEGPLLDALRSGYWETSRGGSFYYRPVVSISYWIDHRIWGLNPLGYHLRNLLLHAAASILVLLLGVRWLGTRSGAFAAAALFAVHPVHTQSVTWIAGRTDLFATVFFLLALLLIHEGVERSSPAGGGAPSAIGPPGGRMLHRGAFPPSSTGGATAPRGGGAAAALVLAGLAAFALALLSKEMAVTFPAVLALHAAHVSRRGGRAALAPWIAPLAGSALVAGAWLLLRIALVGSAVGFADDPHAWWHPADGTASRLLAVPLILAFYLRRILFPLWLGFESGIEPVGSAASPMVWMAAMGVALLALLGWRLRRRSAAVPFGIAWGLVTLVPVMNVFPIFESAMEHFAYLPSVGFIVAATATGAVLINRAELRAGLLIVLLIVLGGRTIVRNGEWRDEETFWRVTVRDTPSARAWNNLGLHLRESGDISGAAEALEEVLRLRPDLPSSHSNLGVLDAALGRRRQALERFREALRLDPGNADALYNMALVLESNDLGQRYGPGFDAGGAVEAYRKLVEIHPGHSEGWTNLGVLYEVLHRPEEARRAWESAIRAAPDLPEPRLYLADQLWEAGDRDGAAELYARYLELAPDGEGAGRARARSSPHDRGHGTP